MFLRNLSWMLSVILIAVSVVVVGNWVDARPAKSPCDGGQCPAPAPAPIVPDTGKTPGTCDKDCAACPNTSCPENPAYEGEEPEGRKGVVKGVAGAAVKPLKFLNRVRPKLLRRNRCCQ